MGCGRARERVVNGGLAGTVGAYLRSGHGLGLRPRRVWVDRACRRGSARFGLGCPVEAGERPAA